MSELPIACELSDPDRRARQARIRALLADGAERVTPLEDGLAIRFPGEAEWLERITELIALERRCCPFLTFELTAERDRGPIRLAIRGPEGTRAFLADGWVGPSTGTDAAPG